MVARLTSALLLPTNTKQMSVNETLLKETANHFLPHNFVIWETLRIERYLRHP